MSNQLSEQLDKIHGLDLRITAAEAARSKHRAERERAIELFSGSLVKEIENIFQSEGLPAGKFLDPSCMKASINPQGTLVCEFSRVGISGSEEVEVGTLDCEHAVAINCLAAVVCERLSVNSTVVKDVVVHIPDYYWHPSLRKHEGVTM